MSKDYWRDPAWNSDAGRPPFWGYQGMKRYPDRGRISGVCAGIAEHWGIKVKWVRIAAVLCLIFFFMPTLIIYGLATFFMKPAERAPATSGHGEEAEPGAGPSRYQDLPPDLSFPTLRAKFKELEERAGAMETEVTSGEFRLRRDFRQMGGA